MWKVYNLQGIPTNKMLILKYIYNYMWTIKYMYTLQKISILENGCLFTEMETILKSITHLHQNKFYKINILFFCNNLKKAKKSFFSFLGLPLSPFLSLDCFLMSSFFSFSGFSFPFVLSLLSFSFSANKWSFLVFLCFYFCII